MNLEKDSIEDSVQYVAAYDELFHMVKFADVIMVNYFEHTQSNLDRPIFRGVMYKSSQMSS